MAVGIQGDITHLILLTAAVVGAAKALNGNCSTTGWFGANCQYMCHCQDQAPCDTNGDCPDGCEAGWFGPQCQYKSAEVHVAINEVKRTELTDNDPTTCLTTENSQVVATLLKPQPFTWLRLVVASYTYKFGLTTKVELRGDQALSREKIELCPKQRVSYVDSTTVDIFCYTNASVYAIDITPGVWDSGLCSLDISVGRNVALKQPAFQSTTSISLVPPGFLDGGGASSKETNSNSPTISMDSWSASNAVDGQLAAQSDYMDQTRTCSHTGTQSASGQHEWHLHLQGRPTDWVRVDVHNLINSVTGCCGESLVGFKLLAEGREEGGHVFNFTEDSGMVKEVYSVIPTTRVSEPLSSLTIMNSVPSGFMAICEVQIFGDRACPTGRYGRDCELTCNCRGNDVCFIATGGCGSGCAPGFHGEGCRKRCLKGYYGLNCDQQCSANCAGQWIDCVDPVLDECEGQYKLCDPVTGACHSGCKPGYLAPVCNKGVCNIENRFGDGCDFRCHCAAGCSSADGTCEGFPDGGGCAPMWFGPQCQFRRVNITTASPVTDQSTSTCFNLVQANQIALQMDPVLVSWVRIIAKAGMTDVLDTLTVSLSGEFSQNPQMMTCKGTNRAWDTDNIRDYLCKGSIEPMHSVLIRGPQLMDVCEVYISMGRNVAVHRAEVTTSWDQDNTQRFVDGLDTTCIETPQHGGVGTYSVTLDLPAPVFLTTIHISLWKDTTDLDIVKAFTKSGSEIEKWENPTPSPTNSKLVVLKPTIWKTEPVKKIEIYRSNSLSLCEVSVYGEQKCLPGFYGLTCEHKCRCAGPAEACLAHTGACIDRCIPGYMGKNCGQECQHGTYGPGCTQNCSNNCHGGNTTCSIYDGTCSRGCKRGYMLPKCIHNCPLSRYGFECQADCSEHCVENDCDPYDGNCSLGCKPGFQPPYCQLVCPKGTYGMECIFNCSRNCVDQLCRPTDGHCLRCDVGQAGPYCTQACPNHTFGHDCRQVCSELCWEQECHPVTGHCRDCPHGMFGLRCDKNCTLGKYGMNCTGRCSRHCAGGIESCDVNNGSCAQGCVLGWVPPLCQQSMKPHRVIKQYLATLSPLVAAGAGLLMLLTFLLLLVLCTALATRGEQKRAAAAAKEKAAAEANEGSESSYSYYPTTSTTASSSYTDM